MAFVVLWLLFALVYAIVCGCVAGSIARNRDRSYGGYFALGFFFGLIGVLAAAFSGNPQSSVVHHHHYYDAAGREVPPAGGRPLGRGSQGQIRAGRSSSRTCPNRDCRAYGRPTLNNECMSCGTSTVPMAGTMAQLTGPAVPGRPGVSAGRACKNEGCDQNGVATSNLVCQACRRDTHATVVTRSAPLPPPRYTPGVANGRQCASVSCEKYREPTSDLVCRVCRRDTAAAGVTA